MHPRSRFIVPTGSKGTDPVVSRRQAIAGLALSTLPIGRAAAQGSAVPRPFAIDVPAGKIDEIMARVAAARLPRPMPPGDWGTGLDVQWMEDLRSYWLDGYDWRRAEAELNGFPQFLATIEGRDVHFYHVQGEGAAPFPLILTHGWPGSVREFLDVIDPLTHPSRHGGSPADAFTVVVPSLPGFAFSEAPAAPIQAQTTARLWHALMTDVLGYGRYAAQGGDIGFGVTLYQALDHPQSVSGIHLNLAVVPPVGPDASPAVRLWQEDATAFDAAQMDYLRLQMNKTQTVAAALIDSPMGTAAWIAEKFWAWSDHGGQLDDAVSRDALLTDIMLYLVTDSIDTSLWFYRGIRDELSGEVHPGRYCAVPTAIAQFPKDYPVGRPPRELLERWYNVAHFSEMPRGGHFAALEQPDLFVADVRLGLRGMRA